jgi:hypothetical protein
LRIDDHQTDIADSVLPETELARTTRSSKELDEALSKLPDWSPGMVRKRKNVG